MEPEVKATLPAPIEKVPVRLGIMPANLDEAYRMAKAFSSSELVPKQFRGKPEDVLVALQMAAEVGLPPFQGLQSIAVINGRPGLWGDGLLALVMSSACYQDHDEYYEVDEQRRDGLTADDLQKPTTAAVCVFSRRGKATPIVRRFSVAQARKAGLLGTEKGGGKEGPWQTHPDRMLAMRARSFAARDGFPDVLRGIASAEELRDLPAPPLEVVKLAPALVKPDGYDDWLERVMAAAHISEDALAAVWSESRAGRAYLLATEPDAWDTLKATAGTPEPAA
jgi:hypothetical protein